MSDKTEKCNAFATEHHKRNDPEGGCPLPKGHPYGHALGGLTLAAMLRGTPYVKDAKDE
jgi:hypothetical protein